MDVPVHVNIIFNHLIWSDKRTNIQACPQALTSLKYFAEKMPHMAVCAAGSLLGVHLAECSFPVGKVDERHMQPMTFQVRNLQSRLITDYVADMAKHCEKQNAMHLERLWRNIPAQLGRDQDGAAAKFVFKDVLPGIRGYQRMAGVILEPWFWQIDPGSFKGWYWLLRLAFFA